MTGCIGSNRDASAMSEWISSSLAWQGFGRHIWAVLALTPQFEVRLSGFPNQDQNGA
jgi:hypothetical protein